MIPDDLLRAYAGGSIVVGSCQAISNIVRLRSHGHHSSFTEGLESVEFTWMMVSLALLLSRGVADWTQAAPLFYVLAYLVIAGTDARRRPGEGPHPFRASGLLSGAVFAGWNLQGALQLAGP